MMRVPQMTLVHRPNHSGSRRRGAMLVMICMIMFLLLSMLALSVDVSYMHLCRTQLRTATDSAARAGGEALSRAQSIDVARAAAKKMAAANPVAGKPLVLSDRDIVFGSSMLQPDGSWKFTEGGNPINSAHVFGLRTATSASGSVPLLFGPIFNIRSFQPRMTATSIKLDRDIVLVMDRSSSMKLDLTSTAQLMSSSDPRFSLIPNNTNSRWAAAVKAVDTFANTISKSAATEKVGVVSFGSSYTSYGFVNTDSSLDQPLSTNLDLVRAAGHSRDNVIFNGATNTAAGIDRAVAELTNPARARPYAQKLVVFLTDGFTSAGRDPLAAARDAAAKKVAIYTITYGAIFDQSQMQAVASLTGGQFFHAPDAASLSLIFQQIAAASPVMMTE